MHKTRFNREDFKTVLPQLEKMFEQIDNWQNEASTNFLDLFYPVGSYYETSDATFDPNAKWGGTWELEVGGLVHIGADSDYEIGDTGGSKDAVIVSHTHGSANSSYPYFVTAKDSVSSGNMSAPSGTGRHYFWQADNEQGTYWSSNQSISTTGVSGTDKNMQPYVVVNRWHRTA